jgi:hypothetical protein
MNKYLYITLSLFGSLFLVYMGLAFWIAGRVIYGSDSSIIFAGGMLTFLGLWTLAQLFKEIWKDTHTNERRSKQNGIRRNKPNPMDLR